MAFNPDDPFRLRHIEAVNGDTDFVRGDDLPEHVKTGDIRTDQRYAEQRIMLQNAQARGLISGDEASNAYAQNDDGFIARGLETLTGIEGTESELQTTVDVLSMGNYGMAALTKARHQAIRAAGKDYEGGEAPWYAPVRWLPVFSTDEYRSAIRDRTRYADVFGEEYSMTAGGIGSFVMDVALDPVTYMTLGTGTGAKVTVKTASAAAPKILGQELAEKAAKEGAELTYSRWGTKVHREAVRELMPVVEKEIAESVAEGATLAATSQRQLLGERIGAYVMDPTNYSRLSQKAWANERKFWQGGMKTKAIAAIGDALPAGRKGLVGLGDESVPLASQMFVETSPLHLREIGISGAALRRNLAKIPDDKWYGRALGSSMSIFSKTWNLDDNARLLYGVMEDTIKSERRSWTRAIADEFKGLTTEEAATVSKILEEGIDTGARNANKTLDVEYAPHLLDMASKARNVFEDIAKEEQKYGILNNTWENYVTHMFKGDEAKRTMFARIALDKGWTTGGNRFSQHRFIASISDLKGMMPGDVVEESIYNILMRRKLLSIDMVNKQKFYIEMQATHGIPASLVAMAGESVPAAIRKRMIETRGTPFDISEVSQWFAHGQVDTAKWGFKAGDDTGNMRVLEWLTTNREARDTSAGWMTDNLRNFTGNIKSKFGRTTAGEKYQVDAMKAIRGVMTGDPFDQMPVESIMSALKQFDNQLRHSGVGPLLGIMPELEGKLLKGLRNPAKPPSNVAKALTEMKRPVSGLTKTAQIPEDLVTRATQYRQAMGILTDTVKPPKQVMESIQGMLGRVKGKPGRGFGFKPDETSQLLDVMFNKKVLSDLTSAEADRLHNFLSLHHGDAAARDVYRKFTGQRMVKVDFATPGGRLPSAIRTNLAKVLDNLGRGKGDSAKHIEKMNAELGVHRLELEKLTQARARVSSITQRIANSRPRSPERAALRAELAGVQKQYGKIKDIDAKIASVKKLRDPITQKMNAKKAEVSLGAARENLAKAHDAALRFPTAENSKALKAAESKLASAAEKAGLKPQTVMRQVEREIAEKVADPKLIEAATAVKTKAGEALASAKKMLSDAGKQTPRMKKAQRAVTAAEKAMEKAIADAGSGLRTGVETAEAAVATAKKALDDITGKRMGLDEIKAVKATLKTARATLKKAKAAHTSGKVTIDDAAVRAAKAELEAARAVGGKDIEKLTEAVAAAKAASDEAVKGLKTAKASRITQTRKVIDEVEEVVKGTGPDLRSGVEALPRGPRTFTPGDARMSDDIVRAGTEAIGQDLSVSRAAGTFGPHIQEVGERALSVEASSYYLPENIARMIQEVGGDIYGHSSEKVNALMRGYDAVQNMFKAPLMAVWPEFYMRNSVTNVALTYLQSGLAMFHPVYQQSFLKMMTYTLHKEVLDIDNLAKAQGAFMGIMGAGSGAVIGAQQESQATGSGFFGSVLSGRALTGALGGAAIGAGLGTVSGGIVKKGLQNVAEGGVATHAAVGGGVGALAAGPEGGIEGRLKGAAIGAAAAGGGARLALGDGYRNLDKLAASKIKLSNGLEFTVEEMVQEAARRGVFTTHVSEEIFKQGGAKVLAMGERAGLKADDGWRQAMKPSSALFARDVFRAGELASEIPSRLMLFTIEAHRTGSLGQAARAVKDYLFDYAGLSLVERRAIKRMMPFYTWSKHALVTSADSLVNHPGRVAQQFKFIESQNTHQDVDPADYPDWLSTRLKRIKTVRNPETGEKEIEIKTGYGTVQEDTMSLWKEMFGGEPSKVLTRGPFGVTSALEYMVDKDFFRGTHIKSKLYERSLFESGRAYKDAPPWMKEAVGYRIDPATGYAKVDPRAAWLLGEVPAARFFSVARKVYDSEHNEYNWFALSRQVLGEKVYKYGPEQRLYHDKAKLDRMAMFLKKIGEMKTTQLVSPTRRQQY